MKLCSSCHCPESEEIFHGNLCRLCYNADRLAYYHNFAKDGKKKERDHGQEVINGLITCRKCGDEKEQSEFYFNKTINGKDYYRKECKSCTIQAALRQPVVNHVGSLRFKNAVITLKDGSVLRYDRNGQRIAI